MASTALRVASRERVDSNARTMSATWCIDWSSETGFSDLSALSDGACARAMRATRRATTECNAVDRDAWGLHWLRFRDDGDGDGRSGDGGWMKCV